MKIDRFLQLFVVKEKKFYPLYIEQAANIEAAAKFLVELLQEHDPEKQKVLYKNVKEYEHSGDMITAKLYEELNKTFVTPFDREDINEWAYGHVSRFYSRCRKTNVDVPSEMCEPAIDCDGAMYRGRCAYLEGYYEWIGVYPEKTARN